MTSYVARFGVPRFVSFAQSATFRARSYQYSGWTLAFMRDTLADELALSFGASRPCARRLVHSAPP